MSRQGGKDRGLFQVWSVQYQDKQGKVHKVRAGSEKRAEVTAAKLKGEGATEVKPTSVWWIRYADANGKERRELAGTKSQATTLYQKRRTEKIQGVKLPETMKKRQGLTVTGMVERYRPVFEAKASGSDDARFARYWTEALGDLNIDEVTPRDVEQWREKRLSEPPTQGGPKGLVPRKTPRPRRSPATVNRAVAFLKRLFNLATRDGLFMGRNPAALVGMLKENNERVRCLLEDEEKRLRSVMKPDGWVLVEISFLTGMRMGEQFNLRRDCVDLRTGTLTIPKSKHGEKRHVHLGPRGIELFRELLASHDSEWAFPSPRDPARPRSASGFRNVFLRALHKAKVKNFHWHDLRHTFGSRLAMAGVELQVIRDLMGHGSIAMTERYAHLCPGHLKKAVAGL